MKVIREAFNTISAYWGVQSCKETKYRLIRYCVQSDYDGKTLLLNTVTGEMILLSNSEKDFLKNLPISATVLAQDLIKHHFLVPVNYDEQKSVDQLRTIFRKMTPRDHLTGYSILPTTGCNARCFYCFESNYAKETMTPQIADMVVAYINANHGGEKIWINWFGGEPMVGLHRINQICGQLNELGIQFNSSMLSNGSLFTKKLAGVARDQWHLKRIQITLDGSEKIYNSVKSYVGLTGNPYYRVLDNIGYLLDEKIIVNVRLNMDFHNLEDIPNVIDDLTERYGGREGFYIYISELFEDEGFDPVHHSRNEWEIIEQKREQLSEYISQKNPQPKSVNGKRPYVLPYLRHQYCMADNPKSILINPLGQIGKCEHHIFKHLIGNLQVDGNGISDSKINYWLCPEFNNYCKICPLYPFCAIPKTCEAGNGCRDEIAKNRITEVQKEMVSFFLRNQ